MRTLGLILTLLFCSSIYSQTPGARWSRPLGGSGEDYGADLQKTPDGGFLFLGTTHSNDIDVAGNHGSWDIWLVKLNSLGNVQWQKCLGGTLSEQASKLISYPDGTAIVLGSALSNDGDVSGVYDSLHADLWVVKIDLSGNILWKRTFGGNYDMALTDARPTSDNGCVILTYTQSNNGDVIGNHGYYDIWLLKLNSSGAPEWEKTLGGSAFEQGTSIVQGNDGSYVLTGITESSDGDVTGSHGHSDLWVVKLAGDGTILWKKAFGGSGDDQGKQGIISRDGSITVLAQTNSIDGDVTGRNTTSNQDCWVLNLDGNSGIINWQKSIGGSATESAVGLFQDTDGALVIVSNSNSPDGTAVNYHGGNDILLTSLTPAGAVNWIKCFGGPKDERAWSFYNDTSSKNYLILGTANGDGGDVTGYHVNPAFAATDAWVINVKNDGTLNWQRCLGGSGGGDFLRSVQKVAENLFVFSGETNSDDGDVILNRGGGLDGWAVLLGPVNTIVGTLFLDKNSNGTKDLGETVFSNVLVKSKKNADSALSVPYNGLFVNEVDTGIYTTTPIPSLPYYTVLPSNAASNFTSYFNKDSFSFAVQPIPNKQDLSVSIIPISSARPGVSCLYRIVYQNIGTVSVSSGEVIFNKDARTNWIAASPSPTISIADTFKWTYSNFAPGDTASIIVALQIATPPTVNVNDTLSYLASITPVAIDETPSNDTSILRQRVVGSFDPNDKTENNGGVISPSFITNGDYLQYTVRFQNTGTADAINVVVRDTLGNRVDLNTIEVVAASHPYNLSIENANQLIWQFDNILLPPSSVDEPGSHGYIVYRIRPKSDVVVGETLHNTASIYFDYNLPVLTNDATTLVKDNSIILPLQLLNFTGQLTNSNVQLSWNVSNATNFKAFEVERSVDGKNYSRTTALSFSSSVSAYSTTDDVSAISTNTVFYRLKLVDADGHYTYSKVVVFKISSAGDKLIVYPNPARTELFVSFTAAKPGNLQVKILDASGRMVKESKTGVQKGTNVFPLSISKLKAGNYILQLSVNGQTKTSKFTVMD